MRTSGEIDISEELFSPLAVGSVETSKQQLKHFSHSPHMLWKCRNRTKLLLCSELFLLALYILSLSTFLGL